MLRAEELLSSNILPQRERTLTGALFHVYYEVLPKIGLEAQHDSKYARVLFKIGGRDYKGSACQRFEDVLSRMGIDIQFDYVDEDDENASFRVHSTDTSRLLSRHVAQEPLQNPGDIDGPRRKSDAAALPASNSSIQQRPRSGSSQSDSNIGLGETSFFDGNSVLPSYGTQLHQKPRRTGSAAWMNCNTGQLEHTVETHYHDDTSSRTDQIVTELEHGVIIEFQTFNQISGLRRVLVSWREQGLRQRSEGAYYDVVAENEYAASLKEKSLNLWRQQTFSQLKQQARYDLIAHDSHAKILLRGLLFLWHEKSSKHLEELAEKELRAWNHDSLTLLKQGFIHWRSAFDERQQQHKVEQFFSDLEAPVQQARDVCLLSKAFVNWGMLAIEQAEKTNDARKHILRRRLFNSWREIALSREQDVQRPILKKFFGRWQRKYASLWASSELAVTIYNGDLAKRVFWHWFWTFCEKRAPIFWAGHTKRRAFAILKSQSRQSNKNSALAVAFRKRLLQISALRTWVDRSRTLAKQNTEAIVRYDNDLPSKAVSLWHHQHQIRLPTIYLEQKNKRKLLTKLIQTWHTFASQLSYAAEVDRQKVANEAFLVWRYRTACNDMRRYREEELLRGVIYKWLHTYREKVAVRHSNIRLLQKIMPVIADVSKRSLASNTTQERTASSLRHQNLKSAFLRRWKERLTEVKELQQRAVYLRPPPIQKHCLSAWVRAQRNAARLRSWAADARFYFVGKRVLKKWHNASEASKRERRRAAYGQVRRQHKVNLAKSMLDRWRNRAAVTNGHVNRAQEVLTNKDVVYGMDVFGRWRARTEKIMGMNSRFNMKAEKDTLYRWKVRLAEAGRLTALAGEFDETRLQSKYLKKWARGALQYRAHQHLVTELRDKHGRKLVRMMFSHWRQNSAKRQEAARLFEGGAAVDTAQSEFGDEEMPPPKGPLFAIRSTAIPAYLNTPSKRSTLVRSMANAPSTTPVATLSTPFERQLRAQLSGTSLSAYTKWTGAKPMSKLRAFEDLVEDSEHGAGASFDP